MLLWNIKINWFFFIYEALVFEKTIQKISCPFIQGRKYKFYKMVSFPSVFIRTRMCEIMWRILSQLNWFHEHFHLRQLNFPNILFFSSPKSTLSCLYPYWGRKITSEQEAHSLLACFFDKCTYSWTGRLRSNGKRKLLSLSLILLSDHHSGCSWKICI